MAFHLPPKKTLGYLAGVLFISGAGWVSATALTDISDIKSTYVTRSEVADNQDVIIGHLMAIQESSKNDIIKIAEMIIQTKKEISE